MGTGSYVVLQVGNFSAEEQLPDTFQIERLGEVSTMRFGSFEQLEARVDLPYQCVVLTDGDDDALRTLVYVKSKRPQVPVLMLIDGDNVDGLCEALDHGLDAHLFRLDSWEKTERVLRKMLGRWLVATAPQESARAEQVARPPIETDAFWTFFEAAPLGIKILDADNVILYGNRALQKMLGYTQDELRLLTEHQLIAPSDSDAARESFERLADGQTDFSKLTVRHVSSSGEEVLTLLGRLALRDDEGRLSYVIESIVDLDEATAGSSEFAYQLFGELAAGIAHDLRNILTMITVGAENLRGARLQDTSVTRTLEHLVNAANRGNRIAERISQLGRRDASRVRVNLDDYIRDSSDLFETMFSESIELQVESHGASVDIEASLAQLDQILLNLVSNAVEAMGGHGQVYIETDKALIDAQLTEAQPPLDAGEYAVLRVRDSGQGMDEETADRIFEPYFSTKTGQEDSGLGLANVYRAARELGGGIVVSSQPGAGSTFSVYLPLVD
jgi:two-component system, cell cycle sensor histidine kinase and response regulator CckA